MPDETVSWKQMSDREAGLIDPVFFYVRESIHLRLASFGIPNNGRFGPYGQYDSTGFGIDDGVLAAFNSYLARSWPAKASIAAADINSGFLLERLKYYIAISKNGPIAANQILIANDPQVAKAVELLPHAAQLAKLAAIARKSGETGRN